MRAIAPDMSRFPIRELNIMIGIIRLVDAGIYFCAVHEPADLIQLGYIDELPLHDLLFVIEETILLFFPNEHGFAECFLFVIGNDQTKLLVKLGGMVAIPADDPENDL